MTLAMELKTPHISFRSRCVFLLALLTAALGLAVLSLSNYRDALFLTLLRPMVEERDVALYGPRLADGTQVPRFIEGPLRDSSFEGAVRVYPGLIAQLRSFYPQIKIAFRDRLIT